MEYVDVDQKMNTAPPRVPMPFGAVNDPRGMDRMDRGMGRQMDDRLVNVPANVPLIPCKPLHYDEAITKAYDAFSRAIEAIKMITATITGQDPIGYDEKKSLFASPSPKTGMMFSPGGIPMMAAKPSEHIKKITKAIDAIKSRFSVSGTENRTIKMQIKQTKDTVFFPVGVQEAPLALARLKGVSKPSMTHGGPPVPPAFGQQHGGMGMDLNPPFTHGGVGGMDPLTGGAPVHELSAEKFTLDWYPTQILDEIHSALVPDAKGVIAELSKLTIYSKGASYKAQQEQPRGPTCFGTLIVCLPVPFKGGYLKLEHMGERKTFDWTGVLNYAGSAIGKDKEDKIRNFVPSPQLQWVAFYGDIQHEMTPVTDGNRLTLTYILHRTTAPDPNTDHLFLRAKNLNLALRAALADPAFYPQGARIAYYCRYLYEENSLSQVEAKLKKGTKGYASKLKLKNEDGIVAVVFNAAGLNVTCLRLLSGEYLDVDYVLTQMPKKKDAKKLGRTPEEVEQFELVSHTLKAPSDWLGSHGRTTKVFAEHYYTSTALMFDIPKYEERKFNTELQAAQVQQRTPKRKMGTAGLPGAPGSHKKGKHGGVVYQFTPPQPMSVPVLYNTPSNQAFSNQPRTINVKGGRGNTKCDKLNGECQITLYPGEGLRKLKTNIRKAFGKFPGHQLGTLMLLDANGNEVTQIKGPELKDGVTVRCSYYPAGDPNFRGGGRKSLEQKDFGAPMPPKAP